MRSSFPERLSAAAIVAVAIFGMATAPALAAPPTGEGYDTLGGTENGGDSFSSGGPVLLNEIQAPRVKTQLTELVLNVELARRDLGSFDVITSLVTAAGLPTSVRIIGTIPDSRLTRSFQRIHFTPAKPIYLAADEKYYVGILKHNGAKSTVILGNTLSPNVLARRPVARGAYYYNNGGQQANAGGPYEMLVVLTPVAQQ